MSDLNETHDPARTSWVASANRPGCDFPIQNLPFGAFRARRESSVPTIGVAIGDQILAVGAAAFSFDGLAQEAAAACAAPHLNDLMGLGPPAWSALRHALSRLLSDPARQGAGEKYLMPIAGAELRVPGKIGNFTDFYAAVFHATNAGKMFRPDNPLLPNYKYVPVAYHSRPSSVCVSGTPVRRPLGPSKRPAGGGPGHPPRRHLHHDLELGFYIGTPNALGEPVPITEAGARIFGFCLLNDWSARDIQAWGYQPLGPLLA